SINYETLASLKYLDAVIKESLRMYPLAALWLEQSERPTAAFLSFGLGPRQCIGMRLALMEEKLVLAHLLQRYDIVATDDTEENLTVTGSTTFAPQSVTVQLRRR
ncbi:hypothetical protein TELCIR_20892, partial [Teladorsagia circumcincta]